MLFVLTSLILLPPTILSILKKFFNSFKKTIMNEFKRSCPLVIFQKSQFVKGQEISEEGCNASVILATIKGDSCIAKLYDYNNTGWENEEEFLDDFLEICETLKTLKESPCIIHAMGVVIYETWGNIQLYLLTEDKDAQDLNSYIQQDEFWSSSRNYHTSPYYYYENYENVYWSYKKNKQEKLDLIRSMVKCVKDLHDKDFIHLDLKLHNMVITKDKQVYLIDYDSITCLENKKTTSIYCRCGTSGYCADEQWELHASKKTDIYSLGVCMVEVWAGNIWEDDYRDPKRYRNQLLSCIRTIETQEPILGKIFRKCVSIQEKHRYQTNNLWRRINQEILTNKDILTNNQLPSN